MYYRYQDTVITVRPGLGEKSYATCKLKPTGSWTTVKTKAMPRTERFDTAVNNLHQWAEQKGLEKADCGCCFYQGSGHCSGYEQPLAVICTDYPTKVLVYGRCRDCLERGVKRPEGDAR